MINVPIYQISISGALITLSLSILILHSQCEEGARDGIDIWYMEITCSSFHFDTGYPFELASVMTYCSFCSAADSSIPVATLKDGSFFDDGPRLTTTDALQIQNKYCKMKDSTFVYKEHLMCGGTDAVGLDRPVFVDRFCDNVNDCENGADENGSKIQVLFQIVKKSFFYYLNKVFTLWNKYNEWML